MNLYLQQQHVFPFFPLVYLNGKPYSMSLTFFSVAICLEEEELHSKLRLWNANKMHYPKEEGRDVASLSLRATQLFFL